MAYAIIDIETTGLDRYNDRINYVGVGLATNISYRLERTIILNMCLPNAVENLKDLFSKLRELKVKTVFQNGSFDTLFLEHHYELKIPIHHDTKLLGTAYDLVAKHDLKSMAKKYLGVDDWDVSKKVKKSQNSEEVEEYLKKDVQYTWELFCYFATRLNTKQKHIYKNLLLPAYKLYTQIDRRGIYIDLDALEQVKKVYKIKQDETHQLLKNQYDIKWSSAKQVSDVLYNKLGLPTLKLSQKTGDPSSDAKVLKRLASKGVTIAQQLLDYKFYFGANTKSLNSWGDYASYDGRIHSSYNLTNVRTGRTSCSNPNLQQVPRNPELRNLFTAPKGRVLIEADYSQIELRVAADYADEPTMIHIYSTNGDIHTETAAQVMGKSVNEVTKSDRSKAKAVNFGFLYGMMAKKFADYAFDAYGVNITKEEAERYRHLFFTKYYRLLQWHEETAYLCESLGGIYNKFGRFISLPDVYSSDKWEKLSAIRKAINAPVQGTASDLLLLAAVEIDKTLRPTLDLQIVGTVHDSILMECPEQYANEATTQIKNIMSHPKALDEFGVTFKVPIIADVGVGAWGSK